ncbi:hypothetical protein DFH08DRAFT_968981 [Mycena albidolilacea]|uniref:DUF6534 domain-containing protein n=1 Tax=Mycena albidolilacea TaxID=1033008 RepID=A0AAD7EHP8_9AGAR|nr:hypothetical protein DFH08DRAFT_968981 [Mycena albidolilacea]
MSTVVINLNTTIGAYQIGVLVSYVLFGVATAQTYMYFSHFPEDSPKLKALVAFVWVCEMGFTVCIGYALYEYTIIGYGRPEIIFDSSRARSLDMAYLFDGSIAASVQGFFSYRIYALSRKLYIPIVIWTLILLRLLACVMLCVEGLEATSIATYQIQWEWLVTSLSSVSTVNDCVITVTLCILLHKQRTNAYKRTGTLLNKLILWTIETGMLTSASAVVTVVFTVAMKGNFIFFGFYILEARLFSNSLLANLNSREALRALNNRHFSLSNINTTTTMPEINLPCANSVKTTYVAQTTRDGDTSLFHV